MIASKPPAEAPIPTIGQPLFDFAFRGEVDLLLTPLEAREGDGFLFAFDFAAIAVLHVTAAMCLLQAAIRCTSRNCPSSTSSVLSFFPMRLPACCLSPFLTLSAFPS